MIVINIGDRLLYIPFLLRSKLRLTARIITPEHTACLRFLNPYFDYIILTYWSEEYCSLLIINVLAVENKLRLLLNYGAGKIHATHRSVVSSSLHHLTWAVHAVGSTETTTASATSSVAGQNTFTVPWGAMCGGISAPAS